MLEHKKKVIAPISGVKVDWIQDLEMLEKTLQTLMTINFDYFGLESAP